MRCHQHGDLAQAETLYQQVIQAVPEHVAAYFNLGAILKSQRRLDEASCCFRKVIEASGMIEVKVGHYDMNEVLAARRSCSESVPCFTCLFRFTRLIDTRSSRPSRLEQASTEESRRE